MCIRLDMVRPAKLYDRVRLGDTELSAITARRFMRDGYSAEWEWYY